MLFRMQFKSANRKFVNFHAYNICRRRLLNEEIFNKLERVRTLEFEMTSSRNGLEYDIFIDCE